MRASRASAHEPAAGRPGSLPGAEPEQRRNDRQPPAAEEIARRLAPLCRRHGIERLEIFGSVARGEAGPGSDADLIVTFREIPGLEFMTIVDTMEKLLGVPVDLLTSDCVDEMTNPYRKELIERDRRVIYTAAP